MSAINPYQPPQSELVAAELAGSGPITASGVLTADDEIAALRAMGKWRPWLWPLIVIPIIAVVTLANLNWQDMWTQLIAAAVGVALVLWLGLRMRARTVKQWNSRSENVNPVRWTFYPDGLAIETIHSRHYFMWPSFVSVRILPDQVVLTLQGGTMWLFVRRRMFASDADWHAATQMLAAKLPVQ